MTAKPLSRRTKLATALPVALVSGLWTANLVLTGGASASASDKTPEPLPDGSQVPAQAIQEPASIPVAGTLGIAVPENKADQVIADATESGIPAPALAAYQRAAQIVSQADKRCNLPWALVAAIGRAESNHGQLNDNTLNDHGESKPGVFGPALNGTDGTQLIDDTDDGQVDQDNVYDLGVGAMQIVPSTWKIIKVDGDSDGKSDPQNINDAALGAAVHLCSGDDNLGTRSGKEAAVFRYHPDRSYANLVLRVMEAYQTGDFTAMPSSNWGGKTYTPDNKQKQTDPELNENQGARPRVEKQERTTPLPSAPSTPQQNSPQPPPGDPNPGNQQQLDNPNPPENPEPSNAPQPEQANPEPQQPEEPAPTPPSPSPSPEPPAPQEPETGPADGPGDSNGGETTPDPTEPATSDPTNDPTEAAGGDDGDPGDQGSGDEGAGDSPSEGPGDGDGPGDGPGDTNPGEDPGPGIPTDEPTDEPTLEPTPEPTAEPTYEPTPEPTYEPTPEPTPEPTDEPTYEPTPDPEDPGSTDSPMDFWQFLEDSAYCWNNVPEDAPSDYWWICMGEKGWR